MLQKLLLELQSLLPIAFGERCIAAKPRHCRLGLRLQQTYERHIAALRSNLRLLEKFRRLPVYAIIYSKDCIAAAVWLNNYFWECQRAGWERGAPRHELVEVDGDIGGGLAERVFGDDAVLAAVVRVHIGQLEGKRPLVWDPTLCTKAGVLTVNLIRLTWIWISIITLYCFLWFTGL